MLIRREVPADIEAIGRIHAAAFDPPEAGGEPVEVGLVDALRSSDSWIPELSLVALDPSVAGPSEAGSSGVGPSVVGHVVCTRATVGSPPAPVLGLGPIGVAPSHQGRGVGSALMHAVLGAADALGEPLVVLLGHTDYYPRFGFRPAGEYGITPPDEAWGDHFQARTLTTYGPSLRGPFVYAGPFSDL